MTLARPYWRVRPALRGASPSRSVFRLAGVLVLGLSAAAASAEREQADDRQPDARFRLPRSALVLGEPIPVEFIVRNGSERVLRFIIGTAREDSFRFAAVDAEGRETERLDPYLGFGGWHPYVTVAPGTTYRRTALLNKYLAFRAPGTYSVLCELDVALVEKPGSTPKPGGPRLTVSEKLELTLGPFDREKVEGTARRLAELLEDPDHAVRRQAIDELAHVEPSISRPHLKAAIRSADPIVAKEAVGAFTKAAGKAAVPVLLEALRSEKCAVRQRIAGALGEVGAGDKQAIEALYPLLRDADWWVRLASVSALRRIGGKEAVPLVEPLLGDPNRHVRKAAERTLAALRGRAE